MLVGSEGGHTRSGSGSDKGNGPRKATARNTREEERYKPLREPQRSARPHQRERSGAYQEDIHSHERRSSRYHGLDQSGEERNSSIDDQQRSNEPRRYHRESGQMKNAPGRNVGYSLVPGLGNRQRGFDIQDHDLGTPAGPEQDAARMLGER